MYSCLLHVCFNQGPALTSRREPYECKQFNQCFFTMGTVLLVYFSVFHMQHKIMRSRNASAFFTKKTTELNNQLVHSRPIYFRITLPICKILGDFSVYEV